jgi:hypothetical protein
MVETKGIERKKNPGASPGSLIHIGERKTDRVSVKVIDYDEQTFDEQGLHPKIRTT